MPIVTCFVYTSCHFYTFSGTNLLTRCHSASSCFLLFLYFRKVVLEIFSELDETKPEVPIFLSRTRSPKERRRGAPGWAHHVVVRSHPWSRHRVVWPPRAPTDLALSPINCLPRENPKTKSHIPRKVPELRRHRNQVSGVRRSCYGTLPGRGLTPGAFSIDATASIMLRE